LPYGQVYLEKKFLALLTLVYFRIVKDKQAFI
jgi:hypothetical protein